MSDPESIISDEDIIRVHGHANWCSPDGGQDMTIGAMLAEEAATRIRELEAHIATYRAQVDAVLKDRALILAERDRTFALMLARAEAAEAALRPLALMAERYDPDDGDGDFECWSGLAVPKIKHLRAARAAMTAPSAKPVENDK